jgi:hypothetical protein
MHGKEVRVCGWGWGGGGLGRGAVRDTCFNFGTAVETNFNVPRHRPRAKRVRRPPTHHTHAFKWPYMSIRWVGARGRAARSPSEHCLESRDGVERVVGQAPQLLHHRGSTQDLE